jgi:hypothetical protein
MGDRIGWAKGDYSPAGPQRTAICTRRASACKPIQRNLRISLTSSLDLRRSVETSGLDSFCAPRKPYPFS